MQIILFISRGSIPIIGVLYCRRNIFTYTYQMVYLNVQFVKAFLETLFGGILSDNSLIISAESELA